MSEKKMRGVEIEHKFTDFLGSRAIEYKFVYTMEGESFISNGVSFAKDGGFIKLVARYPSKLSKRGFQ